jgi:hypothetical protein
MARTPPRAALLFTLYVSPRRPLHQCQLFIQGQMFFDDTLNDQVMAISPYSDTSMTRMYNDEDSILAQENSNGYSAFVDASLIDESDVTQGVLGFITIGVNSEATYSVTSNNYFTGDLVESVDADSTDTVIISSGSTSTSESTSTTVTSSATALTSASATVTASESAAYDSAVTEFDTEFTDMFFLF